jgi:hypothetical protein
MRGQQRPTMSGGGGGGHASGRRKAFNSLDSLQVHANPHPLQVYGALSY